MKTPELGIFRKVGECHYRYSSNSIYYARFKTDGKEIRRSLETTDARGQAHVRGGAVRNAGAGAPQSRHLVGGGVDDVRVPDVGTDPTQPLAAPRL